MTLTKGRNCRILHATCIFLLLFAMSFILSPAAERQEAVTKLKVVTEMANIRLKPDIGSVIIYQVPQGTILESTAKEGEWYLVVITTEDGERVQGYVHESIVVVVERPVEAKKPIRKVPEQEVLKGPEKIQEKPIIQPISREPSHKPYRLRMEITLSGGGSSVSASDLNNGAVGVVDFHEDDTHWERDGEVSPAHLGYIFGGEISFSLSSRLFLGLAADYLHGERESLVEFQQGLSTETLTVRPEFQALPLRAFVCYYPFLPVYLKGGVEYYFARGSYFYNFQGSDPRRQTGDAKARGLGLVGSLGLERKLSSAWSLLLEVTGRYARIDGFKGTHTEVDSTGTVTEEGKLYYFEKSTGPDGTLYPQLYIREKLPTGYLEYNAREAVIDFSGVTVKTGFKLRF